MSPILALLAAAAGAPAPPPPHFACDRPAGHAERAVCGDPLLAAYVRAIAELYAAPAKGRNVRTQKEWQEERDRCRDVDCLHASHEGRLLELAAWDSLPARPLGSESDRDSSLAVAPIGGGWFMFLAMDIWIHPGGGDVNTAETAGVFRLNGATGEYRGRQGCRIRFDRLPRGRWRLTERSPGDGIPCGGLNTGHGGVYGPGRK